jgi:hypothetical protein
LIFKKQNGGEGWVCVDRIRLVQDRDKWWAVTDTVMSLWGNIKRGEFLNNLQTYQPFKKGCAVGSLLAFRSGFTNRVIS